MVNTVERRIRVRAAWLDHYHGCDLCQRKRLCQVGRDLIEAMRAMMNPKNEPDTIPKESLPRWMDRIGLVHTD